MIRIRRLNAAGADFESAFAELLSANAGFSDEVRRTVDAIIEDVRTRGDAALLEYTNRLDEREATAADLELDAGERSRIADRAEPAVVSALEQAAERIRAFHERQRLESWSYRDAAGNELGQRVSALDRVGVYVPGGRAAYPSSVLMNVIPARSAGVAEIIMTVPAPRGELSPAVMAAAHIAGVNRVFTIGGAQAVAALAFGTKTVPAVDKIVGPGNAWVAAAKRAVFGTVGIDMIAGPSEVLIIADADTPPERIAMDLFAQAEHDEAARAFLIAWDAVVLERTQRCMESLLPQMEREPVIRAALERNGAFIEVASPEQAAGIANRIAPEHLELCLTDPDALLDQIRHAGAIFVGPHAAEALGDYCAGPNHVLPTGGSARFFSPLGVYDFQKRSSVIRCSADSASELAAIAEVLARAEGLGAHARSAAMRLRKG